MTDTPRTSVVIGMLTYRRPADLVQVLPLLCEQAADVERHDGDRYSVCVLVVDNDPQASARATVSAAGGAIRCDYVVEPRPGIAAARNRVLDETTTADLLVFIDDDERPHPGWLRHLLHTQAEYAAAAVAGTVESEFDQAPDPWLVAGGFFERRRLATGTPITVAATNNLLLDLGVVRRVGLRFDEQFGLTGGEDSLLTRQLGSAGGSMVWCSEAIVTDAVPVSRLGRRWALKRSMSYGNTASRVALRLASRRGPLRVRLIGLGTGRIAYGAARFAGGCATGSVRQRARGLRTLFRGIGMISGASGLAYRQYRR